MIINSQQAKLFHAFATGIRPPKKQDIVEWASENVKVARSSRSEYADLKQTPWLIEPLREIFGVENSEVIIVAPVGSGKTTMFEVAGCHIVAERPGPTLFGVGSNSDAAQWFQTGLLPALKNCPTIAPLWPKNKNAVRKDFAHFPHMTLYCGGANLPNFQSRSCDYVFLDEVWLIKKSLIEEARRRTHDRHNSKVVMVSQAGVVGDDFDKSYEQCYKFEYNYKCPSCDEHHTYKWDKMCWEIDKTPEGEHIWETLSVWYECPCGHVIPDTVKDRRTLVETGSYQPVHSANPLGKHIAFHYTALCVWWVPWYKLVVEYIKAVNSKRHGDFTPLRQFYQKRLAQAWDENYHLEDIAPIIPTNEYVYAERQQWDKTILTVDVQKDELWYVVRTWAKHGESRLLDCGKLLTFNDVKVKQKEWDIKSNAVFLDSAYRLEEVKSVLAVNGWLGLNGRPDAAFRITDKRTARTYQRLYGPPQRYISSHGNAIITYYSSIGIKDVLFILKTGNGSRWGVPFDVSTDYLRQMGAEIKIIENGKPTYKQIRKDNHFLDCECMQVIGAQMHYCYPVITIDDETT